MLKPASGFIVTADVTNARATARDVFALSSCCPAKVIAASLAVGQASTESRRALGGKGTAAQWSPSAVVSALARKVFATSGRSKPTGSVKAGR